MTYYKTVIRPFSALECHSTAERTLTWLKIGINVFYGCDHDYSNRRFFLKVYEIKSQCDFTQTGFKWFQNGIVSTREFFRC